MCFPTTAGSGGFVALRWYALLLCILLLVWLATPFPLLCFQVHQRCCCCLSKRVCLVLPCSYGRLRCLTSGLCRFTFLCLPICLCKIIHGDADEVVPYSHGAQLYRILSTKRDDMPPPLWVAGAGHNDIEEVAGRRFTDSMAAFLRSLQSEGISVSARV